MENTSTILNSFESGAFYKNAKYSEVFNVSAQLEDVLEWVTSNLTPRFFNEIKCLEPQSISNCLDLAECLREMFSTLAVELKKSKSHINTQQNNYYLQSICKNSECPCKLNSSGFWRALQCHQYIEDALSLNSKINAPSSMNTKACLSVTTPEVVSPKLDKDCQIPFNCNSETEGSGLDCTKCDCIENSIFKFNFPIDYNPLVKKLLFGIKILDGVEVYGIKQSSIQFRDNNVCACLICSIELGRSEKNICEHLKGQRHKINSVENKYKILSIYHETWIKMDEVQQAHQTYFYPANNNTTPCSICGNFVQYNAIELHLSEETHKGHVMKLYKKNIRAPLLQLQAELYLPKLVNNNEDITFTELDESSKEELITKVDELIKTDLNKLKNEKEIYKKKEIVHNIVKSIANPSGTKLGDLVEHRLWIHLDFIDTRPNTNHVSCTCCHISIPNDLQEIKKHFSSHVHLSKCNVSIINWKYFCDMCNYYCLKSESWKRHYESATHRQCCIKIGIDGKRNFCEYECLTCNMVIFGDALTLRIHSKRRKKQALTLSKEVKQAFKSEKYIEEHCKQLVSSANMVLSNPESMIECCKGLEEALSKEFPNCKAHPFGSRISGLGSQESDLDVFVDLGGMYMGTKSQDALSQEQLVKSVFKIFQKRKFEFSHANPVPTARTPIIQVFHKPTHLDCDLSFRHGLSVENSKFIRFCMILQPVTQSLILLLKKWIAFCKLDDHLTTYALSMMVIYFLQVQKYLPTVNYLNRLSNNLLNINGWAIPNVIKLCDTVKVVKCEKSIKKLLIEFFEFYKAFDYTNDVVCPLLGYSIKKSLFLNPDPKLSLPLEMSLYIQKLSDPNAEIFRAKSEFCVQDPFDLSHNLTKACSKDVVTKLVGYCGLTSDYLKIVQ